MKILYTLFALCLPFFAFADCFPNWLPSCCDCEKEVTLEVRSAWYVPSSKKVRDIYSSGLFDWQIEASRRFFNRVEFFGNCSWVNKKNGNLHKRYHGEKDQTQLNLIPISVGVKAIFPISSCLDFYLGGGPCLSLLYIDNFHRHYRKSHCHPWRFRFKKHCEKTDFGGVAKMGIQYTLSYNIFLDIFADYYAQEFHFSKDHPHRKKNVFTHRTDFSGFKFGFGLGVYF